VPYESQRDEAEAVLGQDGGSGDEARQCEKDDRGADETDAVESERLERLERKLDGTEVHRPYEDGADECGVDG